MNTVSESGTVPARPIALSVIAPCYNEEGNIDRLAERTLTTFDAMSVDGEILLVDDGSRDATWERISARVKGDERVRGLRHEVNRGMEEAWRTGLNAARGRCACLIDADLQNRPEDIAELYGAFLHGQGDVIQAVRHAVKAARHRCFFTRGLNFVLNCVFGMNARDNKSGFLLCRREVLADILRHRFGYRYYQSFIGAAAHVRGYRLGEVDTVFEPRQAGRSFLDRPIRVSLRILWETLQFRWETWFEQPVATQVTPADTDALLVQGSVEAVE
ncbi:MAG TPA: glycosyltransferase family 2 protein [Phycisphaerae bacterium]|nr:glycosyltransferase family 2 protein [Phycisphaerae bacterium]